MDLLTMTKDILSVMDGDEVNSISDTEEATQVAKVIIRTFNAMVSNTTWFNTRKGLTLVALSNSSIPTHIRLNDDVKELSFINYNKRKLADTKDVYRELKWKNPEDFLRYVNARDNSKANCQTVIDYSGIELFILNDKAPDYYTSFNDKDIIFDSFDNEVDTTIQESKIQAVGFVVPSLAEADGSVIDLPPDAMSMLLEESTKKAQWWVRQMQDPVAEQEAKRQKTWMARKQWRVNGGIKYPNYGRK